LSLNYGDIVSLGQDHRFQALKKELEGWIQIIFAQIEARGSISEPNDLAEYNRLIGKLQAYREIIEFPDRLRERSSTSRKER
tara:strand:+ start:105 stop:350 length:246 start_codon:yes stop_codon:yes gene_type:complete